MPTLQDMVSTTNKAILDEALESKREELQEMCVQAWMSANAEYAKWEPEHMDMQVQERLNKFQEMLAGSYMKAVIEAYGIGFTGGLNAAFDIVEAKAIELGQVPRESLN